MTRKTAMGCPAVALIVFASACGGGSTEPATPTAPTGTSSPVSGRWVGNAPEGMIVEVNPRGQCPGEFDLELNLTGTATTVSGTGRTVLRAITNRNCTDVLGRISTYTFANGRIDGSTIEFGFGGSGGDNFRFAGTFTASRMTGTFTIIDFPESGRFAVNRQ